MLTGLAISVELAAFIAKRMYTLGATSTITTAMQECYGIDKKRLGHNWAFFGHRQPVHDNTGGADNSQATTWEGGKPPRRHPLPGHALSIHTEVNQPPASLATLQSKDEEPPQKKSRFYLHRCTLETSFSLFTLVTPSCKISLFTKQAMPSSSLKSVQLLPHWVSSCLPKVEELQHGSGQNAHRCLLPLYYEVSQRNGPDGTRKIVQL